MRLVFLCLAVALGCASIPPPAPVPPHRTRTEQLPGIDAMPFLTKESFHLHDVPDEVEIPDEVLDRVTFESIRLLDSSIATRVPPDVIRQFVEIAIGATSEIDRGEPMEVRVYYTTNEGRNAVRVDSRGRIVEEAVARIYEGLAHVPPLGVRGDLGLQLHATTMGGSREPWVIGVERVAPTVPEIPEISLATEWPADGSGNVKLQHVRFVTPAVVIARRARLFAFRKFVEQIRHDVARAFDESKTSFELVLEVHCTPSGHTMRINSVGVVDDTFASRSKELNARVNATKKLATTGDFDFVIVLKVDEHTDPPLDLD